MEDVGDFVVQMVLAVLEEAPLHEIPRGSVDLTTPPVSHGPWPAASCAAVLRRWHRDGWIGLYLPHLPDEWDVAPADWCGRIVDGDQLAAPDAAELLEHPERWKPGHADGHASVHRTADEIVPWEHFRDQALDAARHLP